MGVYFVGSDDDFPEQQMGICPIVYCVFRAISQAVWQEIFDTHFAYAEFFWTGG